MIELYMPSTDTAFPTIVSYSRVSSTKQVRGTGLAQQNDKKLLSELSAKYNLPIDTRVFSDAGRSGYHGHHLDHDFGRIRSLIASGEIARDSIIVVTSLDRISRQQTNHAMELFLTLLNSGVRVYTAMDEKLYSPDSPNIQADLIISIIYLAQAHEESLKRSKRTIGHAKVMIDKHLEGVRNPEGLAYAIKSVGSHPFFVDVSDGVVRPHPVYFQTAKDIVEKLFGGWGTHRITIWLRQAYPEIKWDQIVTHTITKRPVLVGTREITLEGVKYSLEDYYPAILTQPELDQLRALRKKRFTPRSASKRVSALSAIGVTYCHHCGATVGANYLSKFNTMSYHCGGYKRKQTDCLGWNTSSDVIERAVIQLAQWELWQDTAQPIEEDNSEKEELETRIEQLQSTIQQATDSFFSSGMPTAIGQRVQQMEVELSELTSQLRALTVEKVVLPQATSEDWAEIDETYLEYTEDEKRIRLRELVRSSFKRIEITKLGFRQFGIQAHTISGQIRHTFVKQGKTVHPFLPETTLMPSAIQDQHYSNELVNSFIEYISAPTEANLDVYIALCDAIQTKQPDETIVTLFREMLSRDNPK